MSFFFQEAQSLSLTFFLPFQLLVLIGSHLAETLDSRERFKIWFGLLPSSSVPLYCTYN